MNPFVFIRWSGSKSKGLFMIKISLYECFSHNYAMGI